MKCEVIKDVMITVKKGSIVEIDPQQYAFAKGSLKEIKEKTTKTTKKTKTAKEDK